MVERSGPRPRTPKAVANDLHALLQAARMSFRKASRRGLVSFRAVDQDERIMDSPGRSDRDLDHKSRNVSKVGARRFALFESATCGSTPVWRSNSLTAELAIAVGRRSVIGETNITAREGLQPDRDATPSRLESSMPRQQPLPAAPTRPRKLPDRSHLRRRSAYSWSEPPPRKPQIQ